MQFDNPFSAENASLQAVSAQSAAVVAPANFQAKADQTTEWQGESVFPYPPAKANPILTAIRAPFLFFYWTILLYALSWLVTSIIMRFGPDQVISLPAVFITCVMTVTIWIYVPIQWVKSAIRECFDWKIKIGLNSIYFPRKLVPPGPVTEYISVREISKVLLVSDTSWRVPYDIDEDLRYAHVLVFRSHFWGDIRLELDHMPKVSRDRFLLALARMLPPAKISAKLQEEIDSLESVAFQMMLSEANKKAKPVSDSTRAANGQQFTDWWQQDFERTLLATNYVPLSPGQALQDQRYAIENYLASGGQSTTYLARGGDGKVVVVKESVVAEIVDPSLQKKARQLFSREARLLMKCHHPRIASILDHFTENGRDYLVTEFIEGTTLRQFVRQNGKQQEGLVVKWAESIVELFVYLHSLKPAIIHRDLSPDNLILSATNEIHLIDFGAANDTIGNLTGTMIGKQSYMAPEQFRGKASRASDIYAFGGTLYFLLTGDDPVPLSVCHLKDKVSGASQILDQLLEACTGQDADTRPDSSAISATLKKWLPVEAL